MLGTLRYMSSPTYKSARLSSWGRRLVAHAIDSWMFPFLLLVFAVIMFSVIAQTDRGQALPSTDTVIGSTLR